MKALAIVIFLLAATPALAQNPCSVPMTGIVLNPNKFYTQLTEFNTREADGSLRITDFQYAAFAENVDPNASGAVPVQGPSTVPRSAFTLVASTTDCYLADMPQLVPTTQRLRLALKSRRAASATITAAESPWTASSGPFSFAPSVLASPGAVILSR